jgi:hypothetical protein
MNFEEVSLAFASQNGSSKTWDDYFSTRDYTPTHIYSAPAGIGFGVTTLYVGSLEPTIYVLKYDFCRNISWSENTIIPKTTETFTVTLCVPQGGHFSGSLSVCAGLKSNIYGNLWVDELSFGGIAA